MADDPFAHIGAGKADASNNPFAHIQRPPTWSDVAVDVAKQVPAGLAAGVQGAATFVPSMLGMLGPLANKYLPSDPEAEANQAKLGELIGKPWSMTDYLPEPKTTTGQYARTAAEFVPAMVAGARTLAGAARGTAAGVAAGVGSEGAGQVAEKLGGKGTAAEAAARIVGGLAGGSAAARVLEGRARTALEARIRETEAAGSRGYDQFRASGFQLDPAAGPIYTQQLKADLTNRGLTDITADRTYRVLDAIEARPYTTPQEVQSRYKELGAVAKKATDAEERLAANIAQERLLSSLDNPGWVVAAGDPAAGAAMLREANANWAAAQRAKNIDKRIIKAEDKAGSTHSGLNLENELRRRLGVLADPDVRIGLSRVEQDALRQFARGNAYTNNLRWLGNLAGGGGGLGTLAAAGGATALYGSGDPYASTLIALATAAGGRGLRSWANRGTLARARDLEATILERSPYSAAAGPLPRSYQRIWPQVLVGSSPRTLQDLGGP